ncbi:MAG TPA: sialidase [Bacteroidales bacterium]|nr:sialidase [Bacteroidales bacterium]HBZ21497.1 sialidase [Bacteroidales bacterium]
MKKIITFVVLLLISNYLIAQNLFKGDKCIIKTEFIYQPDDVKFPSCHASTIAETDKGLIAAWFGGTAERNPDVGIWISRFTEGKWSKPEEAANGIRENNKRYPCWNPVLYYAPDELLLFYKVGPSPSEWWGEFIVSDDNGISWSASHKLPDGIAGPVKNKPVLLRNGVLLCPSSSENDGWRVHMEMTPDNGITWTRTSDLNDKNIAAIQPSVLLYPSGKLQILCRSKQSKILALWSDDNGVSWTKPEPSSLPNPNSGIDAVSMKNGKHLLVYNHLAAGRNMLNVSISDDGVTWKAAVLLENDAKDTEYSYPAVIQSKDNMIHITYTWNRKLIKHVVIDPALIEAKSFTGGAWPSE